jgi:hypothetical protein
MMLLMYYLSLTKSGRLLSSCFKYPYISVITGLSLCLECACAGRLAVDGPSLVCDGYLVVCSYGIVNFVQLEPCYFELTLFSSLELDGSSPLCPLIPVTCEEKRVG